MMTSIIVKSLGAKVVKSDSVMGRRFLESFNSSNGCYGLDDVYESYSREKEQALKDCRAIAYGIERGGYRVANGRIISHNTFQFTYAFEVFNVIGEKALIVITKSNIYVIE